MTLMAERLLDAEQISCCIDIGHIGMRQASARFNRYHPGLSLGALAPGDGRLPNLAADVQDAVDGGRRDVIDVIRSIGSLGKHVHFHLHDGHPLIPGLKDHFTFLRRLPVPFSYCTAIPASDPNTSWSAKAVTGEQIRVKLVRGHFVGHPRPAATS